MRKVGFALETEYVPVAVEVHLSSLVYLNVRRELAGFRQLRMTGRIVVSRGRRQRRAELTRSQIGLSQVRLTSQARRLTIGGGVRLRAAAALNERFPKVQ